ncbi:MAG TPA: cupin domain-containing protein [Spongiibacteraceae bacterium]
MQLNNFDKNIFLRDYWQQKPLLIKNPWHEWSNPLAPDELAGLACEEDVEARLVMQQREQWKLEHGPFAETRFAKLSKKNWTLLVQAVDHHVPEVAVLLDQFRFIPNWRIDDVMVSYAADQGGVGPHFDQYDVFLIQGLGRRRWQVGALCDHTTPLLPHDDLRLLAEFESKTEYLLEPGDMLYLPPRYAHNGIAVGDDCITYSIGFRAPAQNELIAHWCDHILADLSDDDRYSDARISPQQNPGEIAPAALTELQRMATEKLLDYDIFQRWFGQFSTTRKYVDHDLQPAKKIKPAQLRARLAQGEILLRNMASRFAFIRSHHEVLLFVDGEMFACPQTTAAFAERICAQQRIALMADMVESPEIMELLATLYNQGSLVLEHDD